MVERPSMAFGVARELCRGVDVTDGDWCLVNRVVIAKECDK
jgi:hypothetical protein